jgi:BlaI family transcriptional regulator, penicillinase repressor
LKDSKTMNDERVTDGELSILEVIWDQGEPTSRDIADALYEAVTDSKMASVQKLIERLEAKGYVTRDRRERAHRFRAVVSRETFLQGRLRALADRLYGGAVAPLITTLLRSKGFSRKNLAELRQLIDELWPPKK